MILLYHKVVSPSAPPGYGYASQTLSVVHFERHIKWLVDQSTIVPLSEYLELFFAHRLKRHIAITFDDGFAETFECIFPVLKVYQVPITIFVATSHLEHGELLWGSYLQALCFEEIYSKILVNGTMYSLHTLAARKQTRRSFSEFARSSGDPVLYIRGLSQQYPIPAAIRTYYEGMTYEQLEVAGKSPLIEIGAHTVTHPDLSICSKEHQSHELLKSKELLSELTGQPVRYFAYPFGEYDTTTLSVLENIGFEAVFATISRGLGDNSHLEIERTGVYSPSLFILLLKVAGITNLMRKIGIRVG